MTTLDAAGHGVTLGNNETACT